MILSFGRPVPPGIGWVSQWFGEHAIDYSIFNLAGHNGVDYAVPVGTPILAAHAGRVSQVGDDPTGWGIFIRLVGAGYSTLYAHLSEAQVRVGDAVMLGQQIALSGNTGNTTGPHLHWGLRVVGGSAPAYGDYIDPVPYRDI